MKKRPSINEHNAKDTQDISTAAQRMRLINALKQRNSITTIDARHELNIMAPAARVHELRHGFGWNIQTVSQYVFDPEGRKHRVANYVLLPGEFKGVK